MSPAPVAHLHIALFGFDFNLPLPQPVGSDQREGDSQARLESVVRLSGEQPAVAKTGTGSLAPVLSVLLDVPQGIRLPEPKRVFSPVPVTADLLCDSARLERTGVRLI